MLFVRQHGRYLLSCVCSESASRNRTAPGIRFPLLFDQTLDFLDKSSVELVVAPDNHLGVDGPLTVWGICSSTNLLGCCFPLVQGPWFQLLLKCLVGLLPSLGSTPPHLNAVNPRALNTGFLCFRRYQR